MKKTDRKNKTNLTVTWPTNIFTIKELNDANSEFVEITLRVRLKKAVETGEVNEIGVLHNGKGRPTIVFVYGNPTAAHIEEAKSREVILKAAHLIEAPAHLQITQPPQCMPDQYKVPGNSIAAYRAYYLAEKIQQSRWTKRPAPAWINLVA